MAYSTPATLTHSKVTLAGNIVPIIVDAVPDASLTVASRDLLTYQVEVFVPESVGSGNFIIAGTRTAREKPPYEIAGTTYLDGAEFDISDILIAYLQAKIPAESIAPAEGHTVQYYTRTTVIGSTEPSILSPITVAVLAKISTRKYLAWKEILFTSNSDGGMARQWLTSFKAVSTNSFAGSFFKKRNTTRKAPVWLSHLVNYAPIPTSITLKVMVYRIDGSTETLTKTVYNAPLQGKIYSIPVGFTQLGLGGITTGAEKYGTSSYSTIKRYDVWLDNQSGQAVSEVFQFDVEDLHLSGVDNPALDDYYNSYYAEKHIVYLNSYGGYDTLICSGQSVETTTVKGIIVEKVKGLGDAATVPELLVDSKLGKVELAINTGYLKGDISEESLKELLYSTDVRLNTEDGLLPLILSSEAIQYTEKEFLRSKVFSFSFANAEIAAVNDLGAGEVTFDRPTYWKGIEPFCMIDSFGKRNGTMKFKRLELYYADGDQTQKVRNVQAKENEEGTAGYLAPSSSPACAAATTPFFNTSQTIRSNYRSSVCAPGLEGVPLDLTVAANLYGGETQAIANQRALAYLETLNTQAYADANGTCTAAPWNYLSPGGIPAGFVNLRFFQSPSIDQNTGIHGGPASNSGNPTEAIYGSMWFCKPPNNTNPSSIWFENTEQDKHLPIGHTYKIDITGSLYTEVRVYVNGTIFYTENITAAYFAANSNFKRVAITNSNTWASQDLIYIAITRRIPMGIKGSTSTVEITLINQTQAFTIDWGDGTVGNYTTALTSVKSRTYPVAGDHPIFIHNRNATSVSFNNVKNIALSEFPGLVALTIFYLQQAFETLQFPTTLTNLTLYYNITSIPFFPASVKFITISNNTGLVSLPELPVGIIGVSLAANALSATAVNAILARARVLSSTVSFVNLSGGTNAAPTGQGIIDKNHLISLGKSITTN